MSRLAYFILSILAKEDATNSRNALSVQEIFDTDDFGERYGYKYGTIYKKIAEFEKKGYVASGFKDGKAHTYYITRLGQIVLNEAKAG